jgi:hypothetical protein
MTSSGLSRLLVPTVRQQARAAPTREKACDKSLYPAMSQPVFVQVGRTCSYKDNPNINYQKPVLPSHATQQIFTQRFALESQA